MNHGDKYTSRAGPTADAGVPRSAALARLTWPPNLPFSQVIDRARALDQVAMGMLYKRFLPVVYRFTLARVAEISLAEDLTSDTFSVMIEQISTARTDDESGFTAWLLRIASNRIALYFRRRRLIYEQQGDLPPEDEPWTTGDEADPLSILAAREGWSEALHALNRLTEEQRAVVLYKCVLDYSTEEVGQLLNKQPGSIRALQFRGLASLARYLGISSRTQSPQMRRRLAATEREERRSDAFGR